MEIVSVDAEYKTRVFLKHIRGSNIPGRTQRKPPHTHTGGEHTGSVSQSFPWFSGLTAPRRASMSQVTTWTWRRYSLASCLAWRRASAFLVAASVRSANCTGRQTVNWPVSVPSLGLRMALCYISECPDLGSVPLLRLLHVWGGHGFILDPNVSQGSSQVGFGHIQVNVHLLGHDLLLYLTDLLMWEKDIWKKCWDQNKNQCELQRGVIIGNKSTGGKVSSQFVICHLVLLNSSLPPHGSSSGSGSRPAGHRSSSLTGHDLKKPRPHPLSNQWEAWRNECGRRTDMRNIWTVQKTTPGKRITCLKAFRLFSASCRRPISSCSLRKRKSWNQQDVIESNFYHWIYILIISRHIVSQGVICFNSYT